ncbi:MAG: EamA family transporter [Porphyromonadaceae bacterium]|jgi:drug/metabolite transporter (DMT)-like permease|nr:EamA family transporter [Porphyromonadaceae bacterium]
MRLRAILACVLWGSAFAGAKIGLQYADPIFLSGIRFILAGLLLIPVMMHKKVSLRGCMRHWRFILLFAFLQTFLQYGLFFVGIDKVPAATSSIIIGAGPLVVALMAHFIMKNERMTLRKGIAIALGLTGIVFISLTKGQISLNSSSFYTGVFLLLLSVSIGSYTNILVSQRKEANISPIALTSFAHMIGGVGLLVVSLMVEKPETYNFPIEFYGALLWLALISAIGFSLWYGLLNRPEVKVSELNIWKFLIPVVGVILSWMFVKGETPDLPTILGMVVIATALLLVQAPDRFVRQWISKRKMN